MACAHGIDVETLHNLDVLYHALTRYHIATIRVHLMTVGTLDQYRLSVDEQLRVDDLHLAEAHLLRHHLNDVALLVLYCCHEGIEIRVLSTPLLDILDGELRRAIDTLLEVGVALDDFDTVVVKELVLDDRLSLHLGINLYDTVLIAVLQVGSNLDVGEMYGGVACIEVAVACHARQSPEVLVLAP